MSDDLGYAVHTQQHFLLTYIGELGRFTQEQEIHFINA